MISRRLPRLAGQVDVSRKVKATCRSALGQRWSCGFRWCRFQGHSRGQTELRGHLGLHGPIDRHREHEVGVGTDGAAAPEWGWPSVAGDVFARTGPGTGSRPSSSAGPGGRSGDVARLTICSCGAASRRSPCSLSRPHCLVRLEGPGPDAAHGGKRSWLFLGTGLVWPRGPGSRAGSRSCFRS
jgi:hypothetical protein